MWLWQSLNNCTIDKPIQQLGAQKAKSVIQCYCQQQRWTMDNCFILVTAYVILNEYGHRVHLLGTSTYAAHSKMFTLQSPNFMLEFCRV